MIFTNPNQFFLFATTAASILLVSALPALAPAQERRSQTGIFGAGQPGEVAVVRMEVKKLGIQDFQMQSRQVDGRLAIDAFSGRLGNGIIQGQGLVDWSRPDDAQRMTIQVQNVPAMELLRAFKVKLDAQIVASTNGIIETQWRGVRGALPRQTMNGTVRLQLGPGRISGADVLNQVAAYTGIADIQQVEFDSAAIEGTIRDGMMSISRINIDGPTKMAKGSGLMDLRTEEIKVRFEGGVSPELVQRSTIPQVRALGKAASTMGGGDFIRIPLPVTMSGQIRDPQFHLAWETGEISKN